MLETYATSRLVITGDSPQVRYTISPSIKYKYFYIESFSLPVIYDTFPAFNVIFTDSASVVHNIPFSAGQIALVDFLLSLTTRMGILYPAGAPYTDNIMDNITWTVRSTVGNFSLSIDNSVAAQRLGLIGTINSIGGLFTSLKFNMSPSNINIETNLPIFGQSVSYTNISPPATDISNIVKSGSTFATSIALTNLSAIGLPGESSANINSGSFGTHHQVLNNIIDSIDITITDELGVLVDTYPQRWTLVLLFYNYKTPF